MAALLPPEVFGYDDKEEVRVRLNRLFLYEDQQNTVLSAYSLTVLTSGFEISTGTALPMMNLMPRKSLLRRLPEKFP